MLLLLMLWILNLNQFWFFWRSHLPVKCVEVQIWCERDENSNTLMQFLWLKIGIWKYNINETYDLISLIDDDDTLNVQEVYVNTNLKAELSKFPQDKRRILDSLKDYQSVGNCLRNNIRLPSSLPVKCPFSTAGDLLTAKC